LDGFALLVSLDTAKERNMLDPNYGIVPHFFYRKSDAETRRIIGLKATAMEEAIERGELPPPAFVTPSGRATGWQGQQLIDYIKARMERAATEHAARKVKTQAAYEARQATKKKRRTP
jgi:hypothetical protein